MSGARPALLPGATAGRSRRHAVSAWRPEGIIFGVRSVRLPPSLKLGRTTGAVRGRTAGQDRLVASPSDATLAKVVSRTYARAHDRRGTEVVVTGAPRKRLVG